MTDIVERLRTENKRLQGLLCAEGANRHYWLQVTEIERLREQLRLCQIDNNRAEARIMELERDAAFLRAEI